MLSSEELAVLSEIDDSLGDLIEGSQKIKGGWHIATVKGMMRVQKLAQDLLERVSHHEVEKEDE